MFFFSCTFARHLLKYIYRNSSILIRRIYTWYEVNEQRPQYSSTHNYLPLGDFHSPLANQQRPCVLRVYVFQSCYREKGKGKGLLDFIFLAC